MKSADIYQTLEDRNNDREVEKHGPYFCSNRYPNGELKKGIKEPWLGEGYYFWDTRIEDARWWGETVYNGQGFIICHTTYNQHSPLLFDLVGDVSHSETFIQTAMLIQDMFKLKEIRVPAVIEYLRKETPCLNKYKAIRAFPRPQDAHSFFITFPGDKMLLSGLSKVQICFFDKTLLKNPYRIIEKHSAENNQII